jgi:hypothetical protein
MTNNEIDTIYFTGSKTGRGRSNKIYDVVIQIIEGVCGITREKFFGFQEGDDETTS